MKRIAPLFLLPLTLFAVGCDTEAEPDADLQELAQGEDEDADGASHPGDDHGHSFHRGHHKLDRMCDMLSCTDEQRTKIEGIFKGHNKPSPEDRKAHHAARKEAAATLADAFATTNFSERDVTAFHDAVPNKPERRGMAGMALEIHAVLDAEQRTKLATMLDKKGERRHRKMDKRAHDGEHGPGARLCEAVTCTDAQREELTKIFEANRPKDGERGGKIPAEIKDRFVSDDFSQADVDAWSAAMQARRAEHQATKAKVLVEIHGVLDEGQRAIVAEKIRERGPSMFKGKGRRGHKGHKGHKGSR